MKLCLDCGEPLPTDAPGGNCPTCLLNLALAPDDSAAASASPLQTIRRFGDYELLEEVGAGGMGTVYKARQISLNRLVALKMIRTGQLASAQEVRRFNLEAESAAGLEHPHIVPVYEVGQHEGWHYFAMRFVEGQSLAQAMTRYRQDPRAAATMLAKTARAVHYAHQRGILHRDLKPSNLMLDAAGDPQVTDFGLARRVDEDQRLTLTGQMIGTPAYMAPEQTQGGAKRLSTAADVYSLGVILYELLTGTVPFSGATPLETMRLAVEQEPKRPSALQRSVDRDLETICLRCLEKDPDRRYGSAEALAEELERWLRHEPIHARPSSVWMRTGKWARRRPAVAAAIVLLIAGTCISTWQAVSANRAREEAEAEANKAALIIDFLDELSASVAPDRDPKSLSETIDLIASRLTAGMTNQPEFEAEFRTVVGKFHLTLGELEKAEARAREALAMKRKRLGPEHPHVAYSLNNLAVDLQKQSRLAEAEATAREALAMRRKLLPAAHPDVAQSLETLGEVLLDRGLPEAAEKLTREALAIRQKQYGNESTQVANLLANLAVMLEKESKFAEAEALHREALALKRKLLGAENADVASSLNNLGVVLEKQGSLAEAEAMHREALAMRRKLLGNENRDVGTSLNNLAVALGKQGKLAET